jgi:type IX secretion system PorP/SprF family membrane protein
MSFLTINLSAQDLHFSHHVQNPLYYNPAFTGMIEGKVRLQALYADRYRQAYGKEGLKSAMGIFDTKISSGNRDQNAWGVGAYFYNHRRGLNSISDNVSALSASYRMVLDKSYKQTLSIGFQGIFLRRSFNYNNLQFGNQYDGFMYNPSLGNGENNTFSPENQFSLNLGGVYTYALGEKSGLFGGFAVSHLLNTLTDNINTPSPTRFNFSAGGNFQNKALGIHPILMIDYQRNTMELYLGSRISYDLDAYSENATKVTTGAYLRTYKNPVGNFELNTLNFSIGFEMNELQFNFFIDNTLSSSKSTFGGFNGFETSVIYQWGESGKNSKPIYCPSF